MKLFLSLVLLLVAIAGRLSDASDPAAACTPTVCLEPCLCASTAGNSYGWAPSDVPQMIYVVFQGSVNSQTYSTYYAPLLAGLTNPNGCPAGATYFLSHKYTDYTVVNAIYAAGSDVGVQSLTGSGYSGKDEGTLYNEIAGEKLYIGTFANLPSEAVRGLQPPSLCPAGNNQYDALVQAGLDFDQSLSTRLGASPYFPYTLDYQTTQKIDSCVGPSNSYPGVAEFPLNDYSSSGGLPCSSLGACAYGTDIPGAYQLLSSNFANYTATSTPFLINVDLTWLQANSSNSADLNRFLSEQLATGNTYVVTLNQAADWIATPTKLSDLGNLPSWGCTDSRKIPCSPMTCTYTVSSEPISMYICYGNVTSCPIDYPWIDNLPWITQEPDLLTEYLAL